MSIIIGYLDLNKGIILVSKYWKIITLENKIKLITDPEKRKPNELNYLENNRILVNQLKSEAGEKGKKIITMADIISENNKNYSTLDQRLHKKIIERKTKKNNNNNNKNDNDIKTKKVYWEEESSEQNGNYRSTNNDGNSVENGKIIKNGKLVNGVNHRNEEENGKKEVVKEVEEENEEEEEEEEEVDDTPRITIRTRKNVQNSNNNNNDDDDDDGDILKRYGVETDENEEEEEEEMKQISLSDDGYENDNITQNNGYENKNETFPDKNKNKDEDKNENLTTTSDTQKTVITENLTEITPSINGNEEDENRVSNYDHLLVHVKDIRSESQLTDLIEFIQDGYVTIETAAEEKKRLKRRIKGDSHHDIFLVIIFFSLYFKII
jgi:hypothetical protein